MLFHEANGSSWQQHTTQAWSSSAKCCGSGTYLPETCKLAEFHWFKRDDGAVDLAIYELDDLNAPVLIVGQLANPLYPLVQLFVPDSSYIAPTPSFVRMLANDYIPVVKEKDGKKKIVEHIYAWWDFSSNTITPATFVNLDGPAAEYLVGLFNLGFSVVGANARVKFRHVDYVE